MKKITLMSLVVLVVVMISAMLLGGCAKETEYLIGITQIVDHPALNAAREGFIDALADEGFVKGENVTFIFKDANGDTNNASTIAESFVADEVDMILAISTPSAEAAANATSDIPILITAVTDPVESKLVNSMEEPGNNVSGTHDNVPLEVLKKQLELMQDLTPGLKTFGVIYNSGEINSVVQVETLEEVAGEMGLQVERAAITSTNEVAQAAESLVGKVEAFYIPTDNTVVSAISSVIQVAEEHKIPIIAAEENTVDNGALATYGIIYYELGYQTGQMAARVLRGEAEPATMPIEGQNEFFYVVNKTAAKNMGVELPQSLLNKARVVE